MDLWGFAASEFPEYIKQTFIKPTEINFLILLIWFSLILMKLSQRRKHWTDVA